MIHYFRIGKITTLHGIKGEVKIFATTDDIKRFDKLKTVHLTKDPDFSGDTFDYDLEIESVKYVGNSPVLKFKSYDSIEDSTTLLGFSLYIDRSSAISLKDNEYYLPDLIGLKCHLGNKEIGVVKDTLCTKVNGVLVVESEGNDLLIPFVYDFIEKVDLENMTITLKTLEGLS